MSDFKIITDRLTLRDYAPTDFERVHIYGSDPEFSQYEVWGPNSEQDTHQFLSDKVNLLSQNPRYTFDLAVCLTNQNLLIGGCRIGLESQSSSVASLGWAISPTFQNQGFATEAARVLIKHGFETLKLKVIYATCDTRNTASFKVMEKIGMRRVGHIEGHKIVKGHLRDTYRYEI